MEFPIAGLVITWVGFIFATLAATMLLGLSWVESVMGRYVQKVVLEDAEPLIKEASYYYLNRDFSSLRQLAERYSSLVIFDRQQTIFSHGHAPLKHLQPVQDATVIHLEPGLKAAHIVSPLTGSLLPENSRMDSYVHIVIPVPRFWVILHRTQAALMAAHLTVAIVILPVVWLIIWSVKRFASRFIEQAETAVHELDKDDVFDLGSDLKHLKTNTYIREVRIIAEHYNVLMRRLIGALIVNKSLADTLKQTKAGMQQNYEHIVHLFAHEIRRPLAMIVSTLCEQREQAELYFHVNSDQKAIWQEIMNRCDEMLRYASVISSDLKSTASVVLGEEIILKHRPSAVEDFFDFIKNIATYVLGDRRFEIRTASETECFYVDVEKLCQVVCIILDNVQKHTPGDCMAWIDVAYQGSKIHIRIRDNGPGIQPAVITKIFDPFFRFSSAEGIGFGLYMARRLVEAMRGKIRVENQGGAVFEIEIPQAGLDLNTASVPASANHGICAPV